MKALRISGITVIIICLVAMQRTAVAQNPSLQAELLMDWSNLKTTMDKIANERLAASFTPNGQRQECQIGAFLCVGH